MLTPGPSLMSMLTQFITGVKPAAMLSLLLACWVHSVCMPKTASMQGAGLKCHPDSLILLQAGYTYW